MDEQSDMDKKWRCLWDLQGILCCLIFYSGLFSTSYTTIYFCFSNYTDTVYYIFLTPYLILLSLVLISHLICVFSDPGFIPLDYLILNLQRIPEADRFIFQLCTPTNNDTGTQLYTPLLEDMPLLGQQKAAALSEIIGKRCVTCNCVKPPNTHHCSMCGRCIARLDHHCPWINNCVAYYTQRPFIQMLIYCAGFSLYSIIVQVVEAYKGLGYKGTASIEDQTIFFGGMFATLLLLLYIDIMILDQYNTVISSVPLIDRIKKRQGRENVGLVKGLERAFGTKVGIEWIVPKRCQKKLVIEHEYYSNKGLD